MARSRIKRVPAIFVNKVQNLKKEEGLQTEAEAMRRLTYYANLGQSIAKKSLLETNSEWFALNILGKKRKGLKKRKR